ncbi:MAG: M24 family metallopeptidase [Pseudomonadota bacterium]
MTGPYRLGNDMATRGILARVVATALGVASYVLVAPPAASAGDGAISLGPVSATPQSFDLAAAQGVLAMQRLDGWLLYDYQGQNPVAVAVARPVRPLRYRWFLLIPARGEPTVLVHRTDLKAIPHLSARVVEYAGWKDLDSGLRQLLKGKRRIAMEYFAGGALPEVSRVDAGTLERVKGMGVEVVSSAELAQAVASRWGKEGRVSHYVAVHNLVAIRNEVLAHVAGRLASVPASVAAGTTAGTIDSREGPTEQEVQQLIVNAFVDRGLESEVPPVVASGPNTADPHHAPSDRPLQRGDLVLITVAAKQAGVSGAIYAKLTWVVYLGDEVPARYQHAFAAVAKARDEVVALVAERSKGGRAVKGWEADKVARDSLQASGHGGLLMHPTGHSLDARAHGAGANLDGFEVQDSRNLLVDAGFVIEPGVYYAKDFGLRSAVSCHVVPGGLAITTPVQSEILPLLAR